VKWLFNPQSPQARRQTELLQKWRRSRLQVRLENLPLEIFLRSQLPRLEAIEEDVLARTGCLPALRKLTRQIGKTIGSVSAWLVKRPLKWLSQRRSLLWLRPALVQGRRRSLVFLAVMALCCLRLAIRLRRLCRGNRAR